MGGRWGWTVALALGACTFGSSGGSGGGDATGTDGTSADPTTSGPTATNPTDPTDPTDPTTTTGPTGGTDPTDPTDPTADPCAADWWDPTYVSRIRLTIDNAGNDAAATDFPAPVRVDLNDDRFATLAPDGADLRFVTDDGTVLPHELEPETDAALVAWVRLPEIPNGGSQTGLWIYFGNPAATDAQDLAALWEGYQGVWHFAEVGGEFPSSTMPPIPGTPMGGMAGGGRLGGGLAFSGLADQTVVFGDASSTLWDGWGGMSFSMWVRVDFESDEDWEGTTFNFLERGGAMTNGRTWREDWLDPGVGHWQIDFHFTQGDSYRRFDFTREQWHWVVYDYDGGTLRLYLDGEPYDSDDVQDSPLQNSQTPFRLGGGWAMPGRIDEMRTSYVSRPADWYALQYQAMIGDLLIVGDAERCE